MNAVALKLPVLSKTRAPNIHIKRINAKSTCRASSSRFNSNLRKTDTYSYSYNARPSTAAARPVTAHNFPSRSQRNEEELTVIREKALLRVIHTKKREKQRREAELAKEKMIEEEKRIARQIKFIQKTRQRSEIYIINSILKKKFDEQYQKFLDGEEDKDVNTAA